MRFSLQALALTLSLFVTFDCVHAQRVTTEDLRIPYAAAGPEGLEAVLVRPNDEGPHPLVIVSHGSPRDASSRGGMTPRWMLPQILEFARRGFVAVSVLRRGYGSSPGGWAESFGSCEQADYAKAGRAGAADLKASIEFLQTRLDVDAKHVLAVGVSAGGFATVALTADPPPGLVAAISFAGGRGSNGPDTVCSPEALVDAFKSFGTGSRVPMLWVYAENDHFFGPKLAAEALEAFQEGGGLATFVAAPAYGTDGHSLFSAGGRAIWTPIVDAFLTAQHLPSTVTAPAADAETLEPPKELSASGRRDFQTFLEAASHKAFAVSPGGGYAWRTARGTAAEARDAAMSACGEAAHAECRLYALDDNYAETDD